MARASIAQSLTLWTDPDARKPLIAAVGKVGSRMAALDDMNCYAARLAAEHRRRPAIQATLAEGRNAAR